MSLEVCYHHRHLSQTHQTTDCLGRGFLCLQQWEIRGDEPHRSLPTSSPLGCCQTPSAGTRREFPKAGEQVSPPGGSHIPALNPWWWECRTQQHPGDTRWSHHHFTTAIDLLYPSIVQHNTQPATNPASCSPRAHYSRETAGG